MSAHDRVEERPIADPGPPSPADPDNIWTAPVSSRPEPLVVRALEPDLEPVDLAGNPFGVLRPLSVGQIIDQGFEILRFRFGRIMALTIVVMLPLVVLPTLIGYGSFVGEAQRFFDSGDPLGVAWLQVSATGSGDWWSTIATLTSPIAQALVGIGVATMVGGWVMGRDPKFGEALGRTLRRTPAALVVFVVGIIPKIVGTYLCLIPGLIVIALFLLASPVLATESEGPFKTIARSVRLGSRRLWPLVGLTVAGLLLSTLITVLLDVVAVAIVWLAGEASWIWVVLGAINVLGSVFIAALLAAWTALAYVDVRVRTEGMDLDIGVGQVFDA
jgi:hypothetical protein